VIAKTNSEFRAIVCSGAVSRTTQLQLYRVAKNSNKAYTKSYQSLPTRTELFVV